MQHWNFSSTIHDTADSSELFDVSSKKLESSSSSPKNFFLFLATCFCFLLVLTTVLDAGQIITGFPPATAPDMQFYCTGRFHDCEWQLGHSFKTFCITRTYTKTLWFTLVEKLVEPFFWFFSRFCFFFHFFLFFLNYFNSGQMSWPFIDPWTFVTQVDFFLIP